MMQLCKVSYADEARVGMADGDAVQLLDRRASLSALLHGADPAGTARANVDRTTGPLPLAGVHFLPPLDRQEVWAAGVTYKRSEEARKRESVGAARFYDLVYTAERPELFFKAPAYRVVGPGAAVHIRRDSLWSVPEPELALVVAPDLRIVGYTIGNDMSARDIEGENPLYLPQAKVYDHSCALGPVITLADAMPGTEDVTIRLEIERAGRTVFTGETGWMAMKRSGEELVAWLGRETSFPDGAILLTGTGVVPPDDFSLAAGDFVRIDITGIGRLENRVAQRSE